MRGHHRQEKAERERDAAGELGERGDPRPEGRRTQPHPTDALGPSCNPEDFLSAMRGDNEANDCSHERQRQDGADDGRDDHGNPSEL